MRNKTPIVLVCASVASALWVCLTHDKQPSYQGKSLSEWMGIYSFNSGFPKQDAAEKEKAADAIRHIGTNALPLLLALIDDPPRGLWLKGEALSQKFPDWMMGSKPVRWLKQHHRVILIANDSRSVSEALGPIAAPAIPELVQRLSSTNWTGRRDLAMYALCCIGPEAMPAIMGIVSDLDRRQPPIPWWGASIGRMGANARPLVPLLLRNLESANADTREQSESALCELKLDPRRPSLP